MKKWLILLLFLPTLVWGTVSIETTRVDYSGDGSTVSFNYPFQILEDDDLTVIVTDSSDNEAVLVLNTDYTVSGAGDASGSITLTTGTLAASGETLTLLRNVELTQDTDYVDGEVFSAESMETALDKTALVLQQHNEKLGRAIRFPPGETTDGTLAGAGTRANNLLYFDENGDLAYTSALQTYSGQLVENYTTLRAIDITSLSDKDPAIVQFRSTKGDGGGGVFYWDSTDHSTATGTGLVGSDTQSGIYVAPTSDATGASGAWVRAYAPHNISLAWFGPTADGVTSDSTVIQGAINVSGGKVLYVPNGSYGIGAELTGISNISIIGENEQSCKFIATSALTDNILAFNDKDNIIIRNISFIGNNDTVVPTFASTAKENLLYAISCNNVLVEHCTFDKAPYRAVFFDASVTDGTDNIKVEHCTVQDGSRGGIYVVRYGSNIYVGYNKLTDSVDSSIGGIAFEKSISLTGVENGFIYNNVVRQTNTDSASIIAEYVDRPSKNIHVYNNDSEYTAPTTDNNFKAGAVESLYVYGNRFIGGFDTNIYIEGCYDFEVHDNFCTDAGGAGIFVIDDTTPTTNKSLRGRIHNNYIVDANRQTNTPLGSPGVFAAASTFAISVQANTEGIDVYENTIRDTTAGTFNGIFMGGAKYTVLDNDLLGIVSGRITIDNHLATTPTSVEIRGNKGAQTTDSGIGTLSNGLSTIEVDPDILAQFNPNVTLGLVEVLSGTAVYYLAAPIAGPNFEFQTKNSSHGAAAVTADVDFSWEADISRSAYGIYGRTTR